MRFTEQGADDGIGTARFIDDGGAPMVIIAAEFLELLRESARAKRRPAIDNDAGRLTASMRINDVDDLLFSRKESG